MNKSVVSKQRMFDMVLDHAREQQCKAEGFGTCLYRSGNGAKCFVGAMINDAFYHESMEEQQADDHDILMAVQRSFGRRVNDEGVQFLLELQEIHDKYDVEDWETKFRQLAHKHVLFYDKPEEA